MPDKDPPAWKRWAHIHASDSAKVYAGDNYSMSVLQGLSRLAKQWGLCY